MELPHIGQHCFVCNKNDYLPVRCSYCDKLLCLEHKSNHSDCPLNEKTFHLDYIEPVTSIREPCFFCKKPFMKLKLVECNQCRKSFCLNHRHQNEHDCKGRVGFAAMTSSTSQLIREKSLKALEQLKVLAKSGGPKNLIPMKQGNSKLAKRVRLMKLKMNSAGPPGTPEENRLHFLVKYQHDNSLTIGSSAINKTVNCYTSPDYYLGKLLDWVARQFDIPVASNACQVRLFFIKLTDDGTELLLDSNEKFKEYIDNSILDTGDEIFLMYKKQE